MIELKAADIEKGQLMCLLLFITIIVIQYLPQYYAILTILRSLVSLKPKCTISYLGAQGFF